MASVGSLFTWPWVKIQIAPPVNIPIPTKIDSKMGGEFTCPKMGSQNGFDNHSHIPLGLHLSHRHVDALQTHWLPQASSRSMAMYMVCGMSRILGIPRQAKFGSCLSTNVPNQNSNR